MSSDAVARIMPGQVQSIGDILDRIDGLAGDGDEVSLGAVIEALGNRSYGPFLLIPALIDMSPVGSIPGLPTALAAIVILVSVQILLGRVHLWVPDFISRREIASERACGTTRRLRALARFLDRWFHGRYPRLTQGPFVKAAAICSIFLALAVPPLELLPFATTAPMAAIAAFGLALLVRDGLLMIIGMVLALAALALGVGLLGGG